MSITDLSSSAPVGPRPPFDVELAAVLDSLGSYLPPALTPEKIPQLREAIGLARASDDDLRQGGAFEVRELTVPGPPGAPEIGLLVCRPTASPSPAPAIYHIHGGGMVVGHNRTGLPELLECTRDALVTVVSVEYRLAPENPHPAPVEDCYAGLVWTASHAVELGIDPERIIVGGASAGGGLAAGVALLARDRGGPALAGQLLMYPMLDDRDSSPSTLQMDGHGVWDRTANRTGWSALLGARVGGPDVPAYAAPARAEDLSGLPPTFIDVGSAETFRDEDVAYATRIWQAGGRAELHVWPGGFHGFDLLTPQATISREATEARARWLRRLLGD